MEDLKPQNPPSVPEVVVEPKLDHNTEYECKYRVKDHDLVPFKKIIAALPDPKSFIYVEGPDDYYTHPDFDESSFGRYRKAAFGLDNGRAEWTVKAKPKGATNNKKRIEVNWRVDSTPKEDIIRGVEMMGFVFNFSIVKNCHIMRLDDATVVFYTVYDTTEGSKSTKVDHFIEIEVSEEKIREGMTEKEAEAIVIKYEQLFASIDGVGAKRRLKLSLFDMYRRESK